MECTQLLIAIALMYTVLDSQWQMLASFKLCSGLRSQLRNFHVTAVLAGRYKLVQ
jgi:hypothetical protein